jgi:hypothetical protein
VDLSCERGERTPSAQTVRTCRELLQHKKPCGPSWRSKGSSPPTTPPSVPCASQSSSARSVMASSPPAVLFAAAACSRP